MIFGDQNAEAAHLFYAVDIWGITPRTVAMLHARDDVAMFLSGQMATWVEMDAQMVTKYSCGTEQRTSWSDDDARDKVAADLPSSFSAKSLEPISGEGRSEGNLISWWQFNGSTAIPNVNDS